MRLRAEGCIKLHRVAQTFESAGARNFPVPRARRGPRTGDWKVALTSRLENLLYEPAAAVPRALFMQMRIDKAALIRMIEAVSN